MRGISDYAVVYDISSDSERGKVYKVLKGFGLPIQKSVFECRMRKADRDDLLDKLRALELKTGFVKIYRLEYSFGQMQVGVCQEVSIDKGNAFIV